MWSKLRMDITHYSLKLYKINMSWFFHQQDSVSIIISWCQYSAREASCVSSLQCSATRQRPSWRNKGVQVHFQCAHVPSGNRISKRWHKCVKQITIRKPCSIQETIYWCNVTQGWDLEQNCTCWYNLITLLETEKQWNSALIEIHDIARGGQNMRYMVQGKTASITEANEPLDLQ